MGNNSEFVEQRPPLALGPSRSNGLAKVSVPRISVIVPSYNHAPFVGEAIESVLTQTLPPTEIIVVDDASTDGSADIISQVNDARLTVVHMTENQGGAATLNEGLAKATGDYIAICNSDDVWQPRKLETQADFLSRDKDVGVVFTSAALIDQQGNSLRRHSPFDPALRGGIHSRWRMMRELIERGNYICHPSILARREVYEVAGKYDNRFRQLPDYEMWLRVLHHHAIHILDERLVRFRVTTSNTSAPRPSNSVRDRNEFAIIAEQFFRAINSSDFVRAFGSIGDPYSPQFDITVEKILYLWSIRSQWAVIFRLIADRFCFELLETPEGLRAWENYGFSMRDAYLVRGLSSPWLHRPNGPLDARESELLFKLTGDQSPTQETTPPKDRSLPARIMRELNRARRRYLGFGRNP